MRGGTCRDMDHRRLTPGSSGSSSSYRTHADASPDHDDGSAADSLRSSPCSCPLASADCVLLAGGHPYGAPLACSGGIRARSCIALLASARTGQLLGRGDYVL